MLTTQNRWPALGAALTLALTAVAQADTIFVDAGATAGADNGVDWDNAYITLQDGLLAAATSDGTIDEVLVAEGSYAPDQGTGTAGDRLATFQLLDGVAVRGGFAGSCAPDPFERDLVLHETVLTGDLLDDDAGAPDDPSHGENSLHVVTTSGVGPTAILDGVTITAGNANATDHMSGGGILNVGGSPTIRSCTIRGNAAATGAGMDSTDVLPNIPGSPHLRECRFLGNGAVSRGGGFRSTGFGSPHLVGCVFQGNSAGGGGAIESDRSGSTGMPEVVACTFIENAAPGGYGGAIGARGNLNVTNCLFVANGAGNGGAIRADSSSSRGSAIIVGCTFNGNVATATGGGGAISSFCSGTCGPNTRLVNCIAWGDTLPEAHGYRYAVTYSDVEGIPINPPNNEHNIDADPLFVDPSGPDGTPGTGDEDLHVQAGSPVIAMGAASAVPPDAGDLDNDADLAEKLPFDLDGNPRRTDRNGDTILTVDMGVYEFVQNFAPTADAIVSQVTFIGDDAIVRLDGSASTDVEDPLALTFEWTVDGESVCLGDASTCAVIEIPLPFGSHMIELTVTDTEMASATIPIPYCLDPAALSLLEITKLKVEFSHDPAKAKLSGAIGLPFGVDHAQLSSLALVELNVAGVPLVDPVPIMLEESGSHKWKYRDSILKLDIDWKGARFKLKEHDFPIELESEIISASATVLELKYKRDDLDGPVWIDIDGLATIEIDAEGVVTGDVLIVEEQPGRVVTVTLPFPLLATSMVTFSGAVGRTEAVADHYTTSVGRFKLEVEFDGALFPDGSATERAIELLIAVGDQFYPGGVSMDDLTIQIDGDKWRERH